MTGDAAPSPLLRIEGLTVSFGKGPNRFCAVNDLSLEIGRGACLGLVGESGSGKSVTALAVMGLLSPGPGRIESGRILFRDPAGDGKAVDLARLPASSLRRIRGNRIAMVFQDPGASLTPTLRVSEQMIETVRAHRRVPRRDALSLSVNRLEAMGIPDAARRIHDYPHLFSGGMCQRILIATALLLDPALLIADEPTTALDVTIQAQILDLIGSSRRERGTSVLLITHDLGVVAEQTQGVLVIYAGRIVESASTADIFARPGHPYTRALLDSLPSIAAPAGERIAPIPGGPPGTGEGPGGKEALTGCAFAPRCGKAEARCRREIPPLTPLEEGHLAACWFPVGR